MIKLIIVILAVVWVFPKWSREIMLFIAWFVTASVCALSLLEIVTIATTVD